MPQSASCLCRRKTYLIFFQSRMLPPCDCQEVISAWKYQHRILSPCMTFLLLAKIMIITNKIYVLLSKYWIISMWFDGKGVPEITPIRCVALTQILAFLKPSARSRINACFVLTPLEGVFIGFSKQKCWTFQISHVGHSYCLMLDFHF